MIKENISDPVNIKSTASGTFDILNDFTNFSEVIPQYIDNWQATKGTCSFSYRNIVDITFTNEHAVAYEQVVWKMTSNIVKNADIVFNITDNGDNVDVNIASKADIPPIVMIAYSSMFDNFLKEILLNLKQFIENKSIK
ncbi:MAG: hypothetical protein PHP31_00895 [Lentimicrobiaceae bacterium]|nr:hypothetical protein [Lentimicrobiaceae bacterium]